MDEARRRALKRLRQSAALDGDYFLDGRFTVELPITLEPDSGKPRTPQQAVNEFITGLARSGLDAYRYEVIDEEACYVIQRGEVIRIKDRPYEPPPDDRPEYISPRVRELLGDELMKASEEYEQVKRHFADQGIHFLEQGDVRVTPVYETQVDDRMVAPQQAVADFHFAVLAWGLRSFQYRVRDQFTEYLVDAQQDKVMSTRDVSYLL